MPDSTPDPNEWIEIVHPDKPQPVTIFRNQLWVYESVGWSEKKSDEPVNQAPVIDSGGVQVPAPAVPSATTAPPNPAVATTQEV